MSAKAIAAVAQARLVATYLDGAGESKMANDVRRVCRSNDSYRVTLATLHRDNMELRGKGATDWRGELRRLVYAVEEESVSDSAYAAIENAKRLLGMAA